MLALEKKLWKIKINQSVKSPKTWSTNNLSDFKDTEIIQSDNYCAFTVRSKANRTLTCPLYDIYLW